MKIDLTEILQALITLLAGLITYKLIPWIKSKVSAQQFANLNAAAKVAVFAAEQMFASGDNETKLNYAIQQLSQAGFSVDSNTIRAVIENAVYALKVPQQTAIPVVSVAEMKPPDSTYMEDDLK